MPITPALRFLCLLVAIVLLGGCSREVVPQTPQQKAANKLRSFLKNKLQGDRTQIWEAFKGAFPQGMSASEVQDLLRTGSKQSEDGKTKYYWSADVNDGILYWVVLYSEPPMISEVGVTYLPS